MKRRKLIDANCVREDAIKDLIHRTIEKLSSDTPLLRGEWSIDEHARNMIGEVVERFVRELIRMSASLYGPLDNNRDTVKYAKRDMANHIWNSVDVNAAIGYIQSITGNSIER